MTGIEGGGCISPLHSIIQLQRDGESKEELGEEGAYPLDHGFRFDCCLCTNECLKEGVPGFHTSSSNT